MITFVILTSLFGAWAWVLVIAGIIEEFWGDK